MEETTYLEPVIEEEIIDLTEDAALGPTPWPICNSTCSND